MNLPSAPIFFGLFASIAVIAALFMLTRKTALGAAISLVVCFLAFAGLYAMLNAPFVAVMQVVVYAGAIMMLIIFVIMTVDTDAESLHEERGTIIGAIIATIIVGTGILVYELALNVASPLGRNVAAPAAQKGTVAAIGSILFTRHVLNFEMLSLLLLIALAGALILAKRYKKKPGGTGLTMGPNPCTVLAIVIFFIGVFGMLVRRSAFFFLMSIELMLNSANLLWVTFAGIHGNLDGHVYAFFIMALAAAEACVGLAIIVLFYRKRGSVILDRAREMGK